MHELPGPSEDNERVMAEEGASLFIAASERYPSSKPCQAAESIRLSRELGYSPHLALSRILDDPEQTARVHQRANDEHQQRGLKPVSLERVRTMIWSVSKKVEQLQHISDEQAGEILKLYPENRVPDLREDMSISAEADTIAAQNK
jgi:hypothetical protein